MLRAICSLYDENWTFGRIFRKNGEYAQTTIHTDMSQFPRSSKVGSVGSAGGSRDSARSGSWQSQMVMLTRDFSLG